MRKRMRANGYTGPFNVPSRVITPRNVPVVSRNQPEDKSVDSGFLALVPGPFVAPAGYVLNDIDIGAGSWNRIGRKIFMKSFQMTGSFQHNPGGAPNQALVDQSVRMLIVYDRQSNGVIPLVQDVILDYNTAGAPTATPYSNMNVNNKDRFVILMNRLFYVPQTLYDATGGAQAPVQFSWGANQGVVGGKSAMEQVCAIQEYHKIGLETTYKSSGTPGNNVTDIATGALFLWIFTTSGVGCPVQFEGSIRLTYEDK